MKVFGHVQSTHAVQSTCPSYTLDCGNNTFQRGCEYPLRLDVDLLHVKTDGVIAGGAMRICARRVEVVDGQITTSALGHSAGYPCGYGPDHEEQPAGCVSLPPPESKAPVTGAGSGAAHGGAGGDSAWFQNVTARSGGIKYDDPYSPGDMGSGGGGEQGGQGGGVLHLRASELLSIQGSGAIASDGASAAKPETLGRPDGDSKDGGAGGGSGGSILLEFGSILMTHAGIHAHGGDGAEPGGGGGGGGLIHLRPPEDVSADEWEAQLPARLYEDRLITASGGKGGGSAGDPLQASGGPGETTNFTTRHCLPGRAGPLCLPCAPGSAKSHHGEGSCLPCAPGFHAVEEGSIECLPCEPKMVSFGGSANCTWCDLGTQPLGSTQCKKCDRELPVFANWTWGGDGYTDGCEWSCPSRLRDRGKCVLLFELALPPVAGPLPLFAPAIITAILLVVGLCGGLAFPSAFTRHSGSSQPKATQAGATGLRCGRWCFGFGGRSHRGGGTEPMMTNQTRDTFEDGNEAAAAAAAGGPSHSPFLTNVTGSSAMPSIESLQHALLWEQHKYKAKQHVLRVHLTGSNTATHPWRLPPLTPELRVLVAERAYYRLAEQLSRAAEWQLWEPIVLWLLSLLSPPLWIEFLRYRRKVHWQRARKLMQQLSSAPADASGGLWRSMYARVWDSHRIELGCSQDRDTGWLDVFANVSAPMLVAGSGAASPQAMRPGGGGGADQFSPAAAGFGRRSPSPPPEEGNQSLAALAIGTGAPSRLTASSSLTNGMIQVPTTRPPNNTPQASFSGSAGSTTSSQRGLPPAATPPQLPNAALRVISDEDENSFPSSPSGYNPHRLSYKLADERITHEVRVCGNGTFLSPYCIELGDFFAYDAFSASLDASAATVAACLNVRLRPVCHYRRSWRRELRAVLDLLDYVNAQQVVVTAASPSGHTATGAPALALARALPTADAEAEGAEGEASPVRPLVLLMGTGEPSTWSMPSGAMLLTHQSLDAFCPSSVTPLPCLLDAANAAFFGYFQPNATPLLAAALLLLLLLIEAVVAVFVLSGLCEPVKEFPDRIGACVGVALLPPFASILSPLCGLAVLAPVATRHLRGARKHALVARNNSGKWIRDLHLGAVWNAVSLPNALIAQCCFVPLAIAESGDDLWRMALLLLLPACLIATKLAIAQAYKALAASAGMTHSVWAMLRKCEAHGRARAAAGSERSE